MEDWKAFAAVFAAAFLALIAYELLGQFTQSQG